MAHPETSAAVFKLGIKGWPIDNKRSDRGSVVAISGKDQARVDAYVAFNPIAEIWGWSSSNGVSITPIVGLATRVRD